MRKYTNAIFDCDGVILDSNKLKSEAFRTALIGEPTALVDKFIEYHQSHGGISRYIKFNHYFRVLKNDKNYENKVKISLLKYSEICRKGLLECQLIPGVLNILKYFKSMSINCYVISGGDQDELREVLFRRGVSHYFTEIYGSPKSKKEHLQELTKNSLKHPSVYFGDARSDSEVAYMFNLDFVFISDKSEWSDGISECRNNGWASYGDFNSYMSDELPASIRSNSNNHL